MANQTKARETALAVRKVLVVEDSRTQAERLRLLLEREGYQVDVAGNGREGLQRVQAGRPDLVISDVMMPEMDGYAFCREMKALDATKRIPIVLLTQQHAPSDILRGLEVGADNFITKPFEDGYLLERVRRIFEHLELQQKGHMDVEVNIRVGGRELTISVNKGQIFELLFTTLEEMDRMNHQLREAQQALEGYARDLERMVEDRTQKLLQTEKLATMGSLLAGVAHELNNPLSVVMGQATLLAAQVQGSPAAERAAKIVQAADRCARIVKNFLALARQRPPERQQVLLNEVVQEAVELLAYQLRVDSVKVQFDLAEDLPTLWADPYQLHQVVVNLVTNAQQAMRKTPLPRGLTLATRFDPTRERVVLVVADTGPGIPPDVRGRIFEPFFTTKPPGEGTGLGLPICHGIVEGHEGTIQVQSQDGQGTTFVIELPVTTATVTAAGARFEEAVSPLQDKMILIVDDEPVISELLTDILSLDGHRVERAANGALALEKLGTRDYDLILTDMRMPELDGPGLYREVERRHPDLCRRFVFVTGDLLSQESRAFLEQAGVPNLTKPFALEEVRRAVQRALRAR